MTNFAKWKRQTDCYYLHIDTMTINGPKTGVFTSRSRPQDSGLWVAVLLHLFHTALLHLHLIIIVQHLLHCFL